MIIKNTTYINNDLIKAIAIDAGLDMSEDAVLEIEFIEGIVSKGMMKGDNLGQFFKYGDTYCVQLVPWASTVILAHEIKHAVQAQALGWNELSEINAIENEIHGYEGNVLESDAWEFGNKWK